MIYSFGVDGNFFAVADFENFNISSCTFSSSFGMYGITLSMISRAITPGDLPAPDNACIDVMKTSSIPNAVDIGFRVIAKPVVVQFGSGDINPFHPLFFL